MSNFDVTDSGASLPAQAAAYVEDFGAALVHSAFANPINGAVQLTNHVFNTHIKEVELCKPADENSSAARAGSLAGQALDMLALAFITKGKADLTAGEKVSAYASRLEVFAVVGKTAAKGASTGFIYGGALTPSDSSSQHFLRDRLNSAVIDAAVFGTMAATATSVALKNGELVAPLRSINSNIKLGALSGGAGGMAGAEASSVMVDGKPIATASDFVQNAASGAVFGSLYGGAASGMYRFAGPLSKPIVSDLGKLNILSDAQGRPIELKSQGFFDINASASTGNEASAMSSLSVVRGANGQLLEIKITTPALAVHDGIDTWRARQSVDSTWKADVTTVYKDGASIVSGRRCLAIVRCSSSWSS